MFNELIRKKVSSALKKIGVEGADFTVEHPENESFGDYSTNAALLLSKNLKKSPMDIANEIVKNIPKDKYFEKIEAAKPGFINFFLTREALLYELSNIKKQGEKYGSSNFGKGQTWLIEHTSPNPNKAMHLGHLRNNVTGMAISNIWEFLGISVIRDCIDNDRGIAIAKLMWGYLKFARKDKKENADINYWYAHQDEWSFPAQLKIKPDIFADKLYVNGSKDFNEFKESEEAVRKLVLDWESKDRKTWELWKKVLSFVYEGQKATLERLASKWDKVWHESEHYEEGKKLVLEGAKKGIFKKLKDGAILSNLKAYNLPDTILIKNDGTSLYITQDLALTKLKKDTFKPDKMFWVIGPEQSLQLKQTFAICEQLGVSKIADFTHLSFGYMSIKGSGKMSSRLGNVIYVDDLIDAARDELLKINPDRKLAENIALGAVKYSILKVGRTTDTAFDFKTSLSLEGDSGPYLQYTYARCKSVLGNMTAITDKLRSKNVNDYEIAVARHIYKFPEVVKKAGLNYSPNLLCGFLFELARRYNTFYAKCSIIKADNENSKVFRLLLTSATAQVLKNGLNLLGISTPEKM